MWPERATVDVASAFRNILRMAVNELFHVIAEAASGHARQRVVDLGLDELVRFRNLVYPEVKADFDARGGRATPALWDGERLLEGEAAVVAALEAMAAARGPAST